MMGFPIHCTNRHRSGLAKDLSARSRRAVATVEFAICLPILLLISFGLIEVCSMIFVKQGLTVAAYEAAHRAVQPAATSEQAIAVGNAILVERRIADAEITIAPANLQDIEQGEYFTITVIAPADSNRLVPIPLLTSGNLSAQIVAMKEVPAL